MKEPSHRRVTGPLKPFVSGYWRYLSEEGYSFGGLSGQLYLLADVSRWLERRGLGADDLDPERVKAFATERRARRRDLSSPQGLRPLLVYLGRCGVSPTVAVEATAGAELLAAYERYLVVERSLAASTIETYMQAVTVFVAGLDGSATATMSAPGAAEVSAFMRRSVTGRRPKTVNNVFTALRSLLVFMYVKGRIDAPLAQMVLGMAGWRGGTLPQALPAGVAEQVLAGCDRTRSGTRDFAMVLLLVRLGLRVGEVSRLEVGDIDWRAGEIIIRGKGATRDVLPLPVDVGEALVGYLQRRDPHAQFRQVFLHVYAPRAPVTRTDVRAAVRRACWRSGLADTGSHRFRHGVATQMLAGGADLHEIGQVLRHRDVETTSQYAKVDRVALGTVTQPWPGSPA